MKIFVAYPYDFTAKGYRTALEGRFGTNVSFLYADQRLENEHLLTKVRKMMIEADTCMFDISGNNSNVMLELGIALGERHPGFVVVDKTMVTKIGADVVGWDQLRYESYDELAEKLADFINRQAIRTRSSAPTVSPYEAEAEADASDFFNQLFVWNAITATFDMLVRPVSYERDLISRDIIRDKIRQLSAAYRVQSNIADSVPFELTNSTIENFSGGASLLCKHPKWARWEAARLRYSGMYRIMRIFRDDYDESGTLRDRDRTLLVSNFIKETTLFHLLARNVARQMLSQSKELLHFRFSVNGLLNRVPRLDDSEIRSSYTIGSQAGTDQSFEWTEELPLEEFEDEVVRMAQKRIGDIFWSFGLSTPIINAIQRRVLGTMEPRAFPPK